MNEHFSLKNGEFHSLAFALIEAHIYFYYPFLLQILKCTRVTITNQLMLRHVSTIKIGEATKSYPF
jgi:hypothetical protein